MLPLTEEEKNSHSKQKCLHICRKKISNNKIYWKVRDHDHFIGKNGVLQILYAA